MYLMPRIGAAMLFALIVRRLTQFLRCDMLGYRYNEPMARRCV